MALIRLADHKYWAGPVTQWTGKLRGSFVPPCRPRPLWARPAGHGRMAASSRTRLRRTPNTACTYARLIMPEINPRSSVVYLGRGLLYRGLYNPDIRGDLPGRSVRVPSRHFIDFGNGHRLEPVRVGYRHHGSSNRPVGWSLHDTVGTTWDSLPNSLEFPLAATVAGSILSHTWSVTGLSPASFTDGYQYTVESQAKGNAGNLEVAYTTVTFIVDTSSPTSAITYPFNSGM